MDEHLNSFFAYAPWVLFAVAVIVAYLASRHEWNKKAMPIGQTFACSECGHRAKREHMVPVAREGSVIWYCHRHAH